MNKVQCLKCKDLLPLNTKYRLVYCSCDSTGVDGGPNYVRVLGDSWILVDEDGNVVPVESYYPSEEE